MTKQRQKRHDGINCCPSVFYRYTLPDGRDGGLVSFIQCEERAEVARHRALGRILTSVADGKARSK